MNEPTLEQVFALVVLAAGIVSGKYGMTGANARDAKIVAKELLSDGTNKPQRKNNTNDNSHSGR